MTVTVTNALMGAAVLSTGAVGVVEPTSGATALGVGWTDAGGTLGGVDVAIDQTLTPKKFDQIGMAVGAQRTAVGVTVVANLAEPTLANLALALNFGTLGAATKMDIDPAITNTDPGYIAVCLTGQKPGGGVRRIFVRRCLSTAKTDLAYKIDGQQVIPVTFEAYYVSAAIKPSTVDDTP